MNFLKKIHSFYYRFSSKKNRQLAKQFKQITGKQPVNLALYSQAVRHSSLAKKNVGGIKDSYERLEYLGDAILGMIVADLLFQKFPFKEEGFLTELRSRIVSCTSLNNLAKKIGLTSLVQYRRQRGCRYKSVYGDAVEALVGAFYLDQGFSATRYFVIKRLITPYYDFDKLITTTHNHKSKIIEWSQKHNREIKFELIEEVGDQFVIRVSVDGEPIQKGYGFSKKAAEQDAARKSLIALNITNPI